MKIHDISLEIKEDMAVWKDRGSKKPKISITAEYDKIGVNESRIDMDLHSGTHADAYFHMLKNGKKMKEISLDKFVGKCRVLDLTDVKDKITTEELKKFDIRKGERILLKTKKRVENKFDFKFPFVDKNGAEYIAKRKIRTLGVDSLGVERDQPGHDTHKILFENDIAIIEGLDLSKIKEGEYFLVAIPLKINRDAAPLRAILIEGIKAN